MLLNYLRTVTLVSRLAPKDAIKLLREETKPVSWSGFLSSLRFQGEFRANSFRIQPIGRSQLIIEGSITASGTERSQIAVRFTNRTANKVMRFGFIAMYLLLFLLTGFTNGFHDVSIWSPLKLVVVPGLMGIGLGHIACVIEYNRSLTFLQKLLATEETTVHPSA